ncbi:tol-pal system protein YbgF [Lichenifustis flavocetrariae]|uniref:Cell division coordinator CpoB n=1 Tax=Lichenifustis flavocetrariae TaxID=2949735 RepID=A0AA41YTE4_9HYPH|nr:tol-pal system protein YbgF [Lichenifustis flavocetrariae]MCW6508241.1 tol-pal system protein YbgF [Lichenifustis flavocetrariae]
MRVPVTLMFSAVLCVSALVSGAQAGEQVRATHPIVLAQADDDQGMAPDPQSSAAGLTVRMDRLEGTIRSLTGQIEELQFQNRKLTDDLRKMQQDVDFRFQDLSRPGGAGSAAPRPVKKTEADPALDGAAGMPLDASGVTPTTPASGPSVTGPKLARRTGDAFDPSSDPTAPGAPRPLGSTAPSSPLNGSETGTPPARIVDATPNAPLDLMRRTPGDTVSPALPTTDSVVVPRPAVPSPGQVASLVPGGTRDEYNSDLDLYKQGQYDSAATGLKGFIDKYPRDRLVPDAVYLLGETYSRLGRHREAAEQYLRLSTDFSKAPRAPDALLRLGMSLNAMGVKEQACATYEEVTRRYPAASADVRASVDREMKRARC